MQQTLGVHQLRFFELTFQSRDAGVERPHVALIGGARHPLLDFGDDRRAPDHGLVAVGVKLRDSRHLLVKQRLHQRIEVAALDVDDLAAEYQQYPDVARVKLDMFEVDVFGAGVGLLDALAAFILFPHGTSIR